MSDKISRRFVLSGISAAAIAPVHKLMPSAGQRTLKDHAEERRSRNGDLVVLQSGTMRAIFDRRLGTLYAVEETTDPLKTNFLGNSENTDGMDAVDTHWTGDVETHVWKLKGNDWINEQSSQYPAPYYVSGEWKRESTLMSGDIRHVHYDTSSFRVEYTGKASHPEGLHSLSLTMKYQLDDPDALHWSIEVENLTSNVLEVGELAFPIRANDDYAFLYKGTSVIEVTAEGRMPDVQRHLHEQMVFSHFFVAGHSSYALLQRPSGNGSRLLLQCLEDTALECIYKTSSQSPTWIGTDLLAVHSRATSDLRGWRWNPWVNGHTSLLLQPGERRRYHFRLQWITSQEELRERLAEAGNLGFRILPSMVIPEATPAKIEVTSKLPIDELQFHSDGIELLKNTHQSEQSLLELSFKGRGQKTLRLRYNGNRWTNLHFYCIDEISSLLEARSRFMVTRQFYSNPKDLYHRTNLFLPFDYRRSTRFDENDDVWEVGGTDDAGFGDPLFLAEKNVYLPNLDEIEKLELYIDSCLFRYIQDPENFSILASLYWVSRTPSSPWGSWSKKRSEATWRNYNYCYVANIYHAMYRIGKLYPNALKQRSHEQYLRMCVRTAEIWLERGPYKHFGLITGSNIVDILNDLQEEGWQSEHNTLTSLLKECNQAYLKDPYPYASEMEIDETGQHQVYFVTRYFAEQGDQASRKKNQEVLSLLKAMRGGDQPAWFLYGNDLFAHPDLRGQISCWHAASLNGMALLQGYEDSADAEMLQKGYAGVMSVLHNILPGGMGFGWFRLDPGTFACEPPRTFEGGLGLWGFLKAARSYVVQDKTFGLTGYGCTVSEREDDFSVYPRDGLRKRLTIMPYQTAVELSTGEIEEFQFNAKTRRIMCRVSDKTGLVQSASLRVIGLSGQHYEVSVGSSLQTHTVSKGVLSFTVPLKGECTFTLAPI